MYIYTGTLWYSCSLYWSSIKPKLFYHQFVVGGLFDVVHQANKPQWQTGLWWSGGTSLFSRPLLAFSLETAQHRGLYYYIKQEDQTVLCFKPPGALLMYSNVHVVPHELFPYVYELSLSPYVAQWMHIQNSHTNILWFHFAWLVIIMLIFACIQYALKLICMIMKDKVIMQIISQCLHLHCNHYY